MINLFKITKTSKTGQKSSLFMESETIRTSNTFLIERSDVIKRLMDWNEGESISAEKVDNILTNEDKINEIENIQVMLDGVQNQSKGILSNELYDRIYNLRCDIQNVLVDLKED